MKKILTGLILLICISAGAQTYKIENVPYRQTNKLGVPVKTVYLPGIGDSAIIWINPSDSSFNWTYKGGMQKAATKADSALLRGLINAGVKYTDTAAMLAPFVQYSDTANQMSGYLRKNFALLLQDTATAFSVRPLNNRFLDSISAIRTLANSKYTGGTLTSVATNNGTGITGGTITTTGTLAIDTATISTKLNVLNQLNKYTGTTNTTTLGTITTGVWNGTAIANTYLANSSITVTAGTGLSGGGAVSLGGSVTIANTGVLSNIAGTDITVSGATGNVTIGNNSTLATVTGRGATTSTAVTFNGGLTSTTGLFTGNVTMNSALPVFSLQQSSVNKLLIGAVQTANDLVIGSVAGDPVFRTNGQSFRFTVDNGTTSAYVISSAGNHNFGSGTATFGGALIGTSGTFSGNLKTATYLSIGTQTSPLYSEQLTIGVFNTPKITYAQTGGYRWSTFVDSSGDAKFRIRYEEGSIDVLVIDRLGNVGIGTTAPQERFEIAANAGNIRLYGRTGIADNNISSNLYFNGTTWVRDVLGGASLIYMAGGILTFNTTDATSGYPSERGRVTPTGRWLFNTTTDNGTDLLQVNGSGLFNGILKSVTGVNTGTLELGSSSLKGTMDYSAGTGVWNFNNRTAGSLGTKYYAFQADSVDIFSMVKSGAATFSSSVTASSFATGTNGTITINGNGSGSIVFYGAYSGSPAHPGFVVTNQTGSVTMSHNSNGGSTSVSGTMNAASFSGAGTGLTGLAASLSIGGNSANINNYTINQNLGIGDSPTFNRVTANTFVHSVTTVTAAYTVADNITTVFANASTASFTVTLPAAASWTGRTIIVSRIDCILTNSVGISGSTDVTSLPRQSSVIYVSNGSSWKAVGFSNNEAQCN